MNIINNTEIKVGNFYVVIEAKVNKGWVNDVIEICCIDEPFMTAKCVTGICGIVGNRKPDICKLDDFVLAEPSQMLLDSVVDKSKLRESVWAENIE